MHYTNVWLSILALVCIFNSVEAKEVTGQEARRKLLTLAELLEAEIAIRQKLNSMLVQDETKQFGNVPDQDMQKLKEAEVESLEPANTNGKDKLAHQYPFGSMLDEFSSSANKRSNLLKLANQSARGFGK